MSSMELVEIVKQQLPTSKINKNTDEICIICRDQFSTGDEVRRLACLHIFHTDCINAHWDYQAQKYHKPPSCPICKRLGNIL